MHEIPHDGEQRPIYICYILNDVPDDGMATLETMALTAMLSTLLVSNITISALDGLKMGILQGDITIIFSLIYHANHIASRDISILGIR